MAGAVEKQRMLCKFLPPLLLWHTCVSCGLAVCVSGLGRGCLSDWKLRTSLARKLGNDVDCHRTNRRFDPI